MAWALWQDATHRAAKMHVAFAVFAGVPVSATVTHGNASEREELRKLVQPGGYSVADRGYADYSMFRDFEAQGVRFLIRLQENAVFEAQEERPCPARIVPRVSCVMGFSSVWGPRNTTPCCHNRCDWCGSKARRRIRRGCWRPTRWICLPN